jgi:hypothetical protein
MALLAVVDALEHAIFTAVAANSPYGACHVGGKERHKNQPTSCEVSTKKRAKWRIFGSMSYQ